MRPLPGGEILTKKKASTPRSFIYDVCLGICKHGKSLLHVKLKNLAVLPSLNVITLHATISPQRKE
jgi:hypothetical protein